MEIKLEVQAEATEVKQEEKKTPTLDSKGRAYASGKRKSAIARVWLKQEKTKTKAKITINDLSPSDYFKRDTLSGLVESPFTVISAEGKFSVLCTVVGGGKSAQADAIKHAISKALVIYNAEAYKKELRAAGFLTRDSRVVERKKYGQKKARKSFQFSKR